MTTDIQAQTMELLTTTVEDEKKCVTYRWLSRSMGFSVNVAKELMESYLTGAGQGKVHGTYYVARQDPGTGNRIISLVGHDHLADAKRDVSTVSFHIYSLEPSPLKDLSVLVVPNTEASQLQKGKDIHLYRVITNTDVVISKTAHRATSNNATKPAAAMSKPGSSITPGLSGTKPGLTSSSLTNTSLVPGPSTSTATSTATSAAAPASTASKDKPAPKSAMMNFFGKAATGKASAATATSMSNATPKTTNTTKPEIKSSTTTTKRKAESMFSNHSTQSRAKEPEVESDDVDSEEERDRRLAMSSRLDQDQGEIHETAKTTAPLDPLAIKRRQRSAKLLAIDDDDDDDMGDLGHAAQENKDEDVEEEEESVLSLSKEARIALEKEKDAQRLALENMMLMDDHVGVQDEDSFMVDVEELESAESPANVAAATSAVHSPVVSATQASGTRRRRGQRAVKKQRTFRNERGYMVTEDVVVMEPYSEDEIIEPTPPPPAPKPAPAPAVTRTDSQEPAKSGPTPAKKKGAASGNQSLLNFFAKKN